MAEFIRLPEGALNLSPDALRIGKLSAEIAVLKDLCTMAQNSQDKAYIDSKNLLRMIYTLVDGLQKLEGHEELVKETLFLFDALWKYSGRNQTYRTNVKNKKEPSQKEKE